VSADESSVLPTRRTERIAVELCFEGCFAAIPVEQIETHRKWHAERKRASS